MATWRRAKRAANHAIAQHGGAVSHQHGVGTMHADLYAHIAPYQLVDTWRAAANRLDPRNHLNPGKLFDHPSAGIVPINAVKSDDAATGVTTSP
jgi:alkyldihydroxyacetonephosphate synthase